MNRLELIRKVREDYLDDVSDNPDQSDEGLNWSDSFLARALAEAEFEACRRTDLIYDDSTAAVTQITLVSGTAGYTLSSKITKIENVVYNDAPLEHKTEEGLAAENGADWRADTGEPASYIIKGKTIRFYPVPTDDEATDIVYLEVYRLPLKSFVDAPEIPEEYHEDLCSYAAHLAWKRRDEDTYDPKKVVEMMMEFNEAFGPPVNARVREHQKRSPKTLRFRPDYGYSDNARSRDDYVNEDNW